MNDVTQVLKRIDAGEERATDELLTIVYGELRHLASRRLARELPGFIEIGSLAIGTGAGRSSPGLRPGASPG